MIDLLFCCCQFQVEVAVFEQWGMQQPDFYFSKVFMLVADGVYAECYYRLSWNVMILLQKNDNTVVTIAVASFK